jgi:hypothetical protein
LISYQFSGSRVRLVHPSSRRARCVVAVRNDSSCRAGARTRVRRTERLAFFPSVILCGMIRVHQRSSAAKNFPRYSSSPGNRKHDKPRIKMMNADQVTENLGALILGVRSPRPESPDGERTHDPFSRATSKMAPRIASLLRDLSIRRIRPGSSPSFSLITSVQNPVCSSLVRSRNKPVIAETAMFEPAPIQTLARSGSRTRAPKIRRANPTAMRT